MSERFMYKRRYILTVIARGILIAVIPCIAFLVLVGAVFPPESGWGCFFWILGILAIWIGFLASLAQLLGSSLPNWIGWDILRVLRSFERTTMRTLAGVRDTLTWKSRHIDRKEAEKARTALERGRPVLITGESGSGKSGIVAAIVRRAQEQGTPALFLDTRNYSSAVSTFGDLEKYVGTCLPLIECLERLAKHSDGCLLAVDQLDSAIGMPALQISVELLVGAAALDRVQVVAAGCVLESVEYQPIRDMSFEIVETSSLDSELVSGMLQEMGLGSPSQAMLALANNLFYLSLVADLARQHDIGQVDSQIVLMEKYRVALEQSEGSDVVQVAIDLAYEKLHAGRMDFTLPRVQEKALQRLQNKGVIIALGYEFYRFRHEQLFYYFYVRGAIEREVAPETMLGHIASHLVEGTLVWVPRVYHHRQQWPQLANYIQYALIECKELDFYKKATLLDEVLTWRNADEISTVVDIVLEATAASESLHRYFFRHLAENENLGWFELLRQRCVFEASPEPVECDGKTEYPTWFALWYLVAIASKLSSQVIQVAQSVRTQDPYVMSEFVHAALQMPPSYAAQIVPLVIRWADQGLQIGESVHTLAVYLARQSMWRDALALVDLIFSPKVKQVSEEVRTSPLYFPKATARVDAYLLVEFIQAHLPFFLEQCPLDMLDIIEKNLGKAIDIARHPTSSIWRPAIEPHEQNLGFGDIEELLVEAGVKALEAAVAKAPDQAKTILERYLEHRHSVFRRLAIHTVRVSASLWPVLLERLFADRCYLDDGDVHHEYWMLMHHTFTLLPESVRDSFVSQILDGLPPEQAKDTNEYGWRRDAALGQLWAIKDFLTDDGHLKLLDELVGEYGEPDHPDFLSYSTSRIGSVSPRTAQELGQMTADEILAELERELPLDSFDGPTQEGLAHALRFAIVSAPEHFARIAPELSRPTISPLCTAEALRGFQDAWKEGKAFDWVPVMQLCHTVVQKPVEGESVDGGVPIDMRPDYLLTTYAEARNAVAELLEVGTVRDDHAIQAELLPQVRDILLTLADDVNPSVEYERNLLTEYSYDVLTIALNVTRGKAVEALIRYALHLARVNKGTENEVQAGGSRLETQVKNKLTEKLDKLADPSLAVHSLFGKFLPNLNYLDEGWLLEHLEDIFPRHPEKSDYWEAAWDSYMFRSDFFGHLYAKLKPYYRHAIEQMALGAEGRAGAELSRRRLTVHLMMLYWRGAETLEEVDSLIPLFFRAAPDDDRAVFVSSLGRDLGKARPEADSEAWMRAKALWLTRIREIVDAVGSQARELADFGQELGAFSQWVSSIPEPLDPFYQLIERSGLVADRGDLIRLLVFLATVVQGHTRFTVSLLEKVVEREPEVWFWGPNAKTVRTILAAAMTSGDEATRDCATRVINWFGERGDERYRDLLKLG